MQHYGISDARGCTKNRERHVDHILRKYPELLVSLNCVRSCDAVKSERRILRRDTERTRRYRRAKRVASPRVKRLEGALMEEAGNVLLFNCPVCRNVLKSPVTVECGHTFCSDCLDGPKNANCATCAADLDTTRCVNVLVQDLVEKWRERNKSAATDASTPSALDILGIEPRYHLRSGFAGLQINEINRLQIDFDNLRKASYDMIKTLEGSRASRQTATPDVSTKKPTTFRNAFKDIDDIREKAMKYCWDTVASGDLECILCSRCILDPVTTSCGHTFCRGCLTRVLDHGLSCPLCMAALGVKDYSRGTNVVLDQAIRFLLPREYDERLQLNLKENVLLNKNSELPVFVCTNAFPGVACPLYVYEPRYRLLVRRCLLSPTRRFAMAAKEGSGEKFVSYGTVLEVKDAVYLEDGSFILTTAGVRRFKVVSKDEQDGYDTAKVQYIKDMAVSAEKLPELLSLHQKVHRKASKWILSLTPKVLAEVERLIGKMPKVEKNWLSLPDGPSWTWWLMPILPLSSQLQVGFLSTTSLEKRLRAIDKMLERMKVRMKALERNTLNCSPSEHTSESCSDERTFEIPLTN